MILCLVYGLLHQLVSIKLILVFPTISVYLRNKLYDLHKVIQGSFSWNHSTGITREQNFCYAAQTSEKKSQNVLQNK